jgi:glutamate synthase (NADPH/NADH) small chain
VAGIEHRYRGSLLRPLKALSFLGREPVTLPFAPREAAPVYRGFHVNDWNLCIGCGTCASICDNRAIRMIHIPDLPADPLKGVKPRRPAIDYGRCCWCALCVDVCPTGSLATSREYIHVSQNLDTFFILPDEKGIHGFEFPKGWAKSEDSDFLDLHRRTMPQIEPEVRLDSTAETVLGFDGQTALLEASRCIQCGMCHDACPTHMNAPEYIRAVWSGDAEEAVRQIYRTMPFGHVCGRVCTHRCEAACSLGRRGEPIAIRWLKRFAMDNVPHERVKEIVSEGRTAAPSGRKVAMVGGGPASLTAAFDLARLGHQVTVFETQPEPGGMVRYGIPEYRMPRARLQDDIDVIRAMGVEVRCNARVGRDVSMEQLEQDYDAVLLATGLHVGRSTRVPGSDHPKVLRAVELLRAMWQGETVEVTERLVVIGGGNVAMDIGRSMARLQKSRYGKVDVTLTCLESREQMLADAEEIREAEEEGLRIFPARGPKYCLVEADGLKGLQTVRCISIFDEQGRFHPLYDESDEEFYEADAVIEAIGQAADLEYLGPALTDRIEWQRGRIKVDADGRTNLSWLWAAGDLVEGPDVVHAVAAGHRAARSMHADLVSQLAETVA